MKLHATGSSFSWMLGPGEFHDKARIGLVIRLRLTRDPVYARYKMGFPDYVGVKESVVVRRARAKAIRVYTTSEVARSLKVHKMVILRWIAKGEVQHPAHYCVHNGICLL